MNNGSKKLIWTVMISACGVIFIGFMTWMSAINQHLVIIDNAEASRGERIAAVESVVKSVDTRLTRIENKLDLIVDRQSLQRLK